METGKISESILKRSVLKNIRHRRDEVAWKAGSADDCAFVSVGENKISLAINPVICMGKGEGYGKLAVYRAVNNIAAAGGETVGVLISILLPESSQESYLKLLMKEMEDAAACLGIEIMGGHTEVSAAVLYPVIHVTAMGQSCMDGEFHVREFRAGQELVLTGFAGGSGTSLIAMDGKEKLLTRYREDTVERAQSFLGDCSVVEAARETKKILSTLGEKGCGMHNAANGGVFGALYGISGAASVGFSVDLRKIPLRQETVEICEFYDLNPYMLLSEGNLVIGTQNGMALAGALNEAGIKAEVIGYVTKGQDKLVKNGEETRCLDLPKGDELVRYYFGNEMLRLETQPEISVRDRNEVDYGIT